MVTLVGKVLQNEDERSSSIASLTKSVVRAAAAEFGRWRSICSCPKVSKRSDPKGNERIAGVYLVLPEEKRSELARRKSSSGRLTARVEREYVAKWPMFLSTRRMALLIFASSLSSTIVDDFCAVGLILNWIFEIG